MKTNYLKLVTLLVATVVTSAACDKDDPTPEIAKGEIAIVSALPNPNGMSGSTYLQLIDDLSPKTYDNKTAFPFTLADQIVMRGEDLYVLSFAESDVIKKYTRGSDKKLSETGQLTVEANAAPAGIILKNATKAYISLSGRGKLLIINPSTMTKTGEIDLKSYAVGDDNPDPSQMIIRDGKLFVTLHQMVGGYFPAPDRKKSDVLIINTETDVVEKMITEETSGISQPSRIVDCKQIFMDENKDIYIVCMGAFGAVPGHKMGVLRIKNGETEFDNSYNFNMSDATISGESNKSNMPSMVQYGGNGKLYALLNIPAYMSNPPNYVADKNCIAVEIDLYAKTIKKLDLPKGNMYGGVGIYNDKIIFGISSDTENGFYTYDMTTQEASSTALIKTTGFPALFRHFGEKY